MFVNVPTARTQSSKESLLDGEEQTEIGASPTPNTLTWTNCIGSVFSPPSGWFHQHFNIGKGPARYLAIASAMSTAQFGKHPVGSPLETSISIKKGGSQIEYEDEAPEVRRLFEQELAKEGTKLKMPPIVRR